jgi:cytochrome oxidase assembly protein ShyY1
MTPLLRPRWIVGHLLALIGIVSFVFLGMWQLRRYDEKSALRDTVSAAVERPAVALADVPEGAFARVIVGGTLDTDFEMRVLRSNGGESGYEIITPLLLDDGTAVVVDRGWIPLDTPVPSAPRTIEGEGVLWPAESGSIPEVFPEFASHIDPAVVGAFADYDVRPEYLILTTQAPDFDPLIRPPEIGEVSLGPHLGYAGQWFLFTAVVLVGYPILLRKRAGSGRRLAVGLSEGEGRDTLVDSPD